ASVPSSVTIAANTTSANFTVSTTTVASTSVGNITANYGGVNKSATMTVNPAPSAALSSVVLNPSTVVGGTSSVGTVTLTNVAPPSGLIVNLASSKPARATVPATVTVPGGAISTTFNVATTVTNKKVSVNINATYGGVKKIATLTVLRR
ncbi:MAG TPA: hypothetical protein VHV54_27925, partial [Candidatus Binatia bacterium]|nr:hypothetical protein [Candidatus Binatia bacterium]